MGGLGAFSGFGFRPFFGGWNPAADENDTSTPVDGDALADPNHPGHRDAVATISHVDDDKHERILSWLHAEIHKLEHGGDTPA
jgi:hypothetical protein